MSYYELPEKAQPPRSIWHSVDKCQDFIKKNIHAKEDRNGGFLEFTDSEFENANR